MNYVPIKQGDFVLAWADGHQDIDGDMVAAVERLIYAGAGWDCDPAPMVFDVHHVVRVMAKTFVHENMPSRWNKKTLRHKSRSIVIAAGSSEGEMIAMRDRLYSIGAAADVAVRKETSRILAQTLPPFETAVRRRAMRELQATLPHFVGGA